MKRHEHQHRRLAIWEMHDTSVIGGGNLGNPAAVWQALG